MIEFKAFSQKLEFYNEDLNFKISDGYFIVDGIYYFSNVSDKPLQQILFYPFPVNDSLYGTVDTIAVIDIGGDKKNHHISKTKHGASFTIKLNAFETTKYRIYYKQKLLKNQAEYILTTTQNWHKPLEKGIYSLTTSHKLKIETFSYQPDSIAKTEKENIYYWKKNNFMPDKNMIFQY